MATVSQTKISADYSAYRNYNKKQKKNILMNRLQIDSGYPQDIFIKNTPYKSHNYIEDNKKNLKNFFKDRLPDDQINKDTFKAKTTIFDPLRIFQIKRQQFQLKNQTKMTLNGTFINRKQKSLSVQSRDIQKISQIFFINDKTLEFKKKFGSLNVPRFDSYSKDNYRRGTRSFMQKRSRILKRQAYEKVFGPDISSVSRTLPVTPSLEQQRIQKESFIQKNNKKRSTYEKPQSKKQDLSKLIKKIDDFKNKIKPVKLSYHQQQCENIQNLSFQNEQNQKQKRQAQIQNQRNKQKVLELIQNITSMYKGQAIEDNRTKIASIEDLQKLDSKFYSELSQHKKTRMQKRMYQLYKYTVPESNTLISSKVNSQTQRVNSMYQNRGMRRHPSDILTITDHANYQETSLQNIQLRKRLTVQQKLKFIGLHLVKVNLLADFYMVQPKCLYSAFWQQREPFQMEGSYAFFKSIKLNDLENIQSFIKIDIKYLYETDTNGRTPLIYACIHNHHQIVSYFLQLGSNLDKVCNNKKTALYYALNNKNIEIVTLLLKYGASPWSSNDYPYRRMLQQIGNESFQIVFSNAKKINLGVRLQLGSKKKKQFWHSNKKKINYHSKIEF